MSREVRYTVSNGFSVGPIDHVEHRAYSVHFCDPYGNRYEVTTYDYEEVANRLSASWAE